MFRKITLILLVLCLACSKVVQNDPPNQTFTFMGELRSLTATSGVIHEARSRTDITFEVNGSTKIAGDPRVSDHVQVTVTETTRGHFTATSVTKSKPGWQ